MRRDDFLQNVFRAVVLKGDTTNFVNNHIIQVLDCHQSYVESFFKLPSTGGYQLYVEKVAIDNQNEQVLWESVCFDKSILTSPNLEQTLRANSVQLHNIHVDTVLGKIITHQNGGGFISCRNIHVPGDRVCDHHEHCKWEHTACRSWRQSDSRSMAGILRCCL